MAIDVKQPIDWTDPAAVEEAKRVSFRDAMADSFGLSRGMSDDELMLAAVRQCAAMRAELIEARVAYCSAVADLEITQRRLLELEQLVDEALQEAN
jgi:hypothetical protein